MELFDWIYDKTTDFSDAFDSYIYPEEGHLNGYTGDPNYNGESTNDETTVEQPIKGGDGNPNANQIEQTYFVDGGDGYIYLFDQNYTYITRYPVSNETTDEPEYSVSTNPPTQEAPSESLYYDELGNLWDSNGNLIEPATNNNNSNNSDGVIRDELGDVVIREPTNTSNYEIINTPDGNDLDDDFWEKNNLTPPNRNNGNYNNNIKINYNETIGNRAAYYAP